MMVRATSRPNIH